MQELTVRNAGKIRKAGQKLEEARALLLEAEIESDTQIHAEREAVKCWRETLRLQAIQLAGFAMLKKLPDRVPGDV